MNVNDKFEAGFIALMMTGVVVIAAAVWFL